MSKVTKKYHVAAIAAQDLDLVWSEVKDYIQLAIDRGMGTHLVEDVYKEIASGRNVLWVISDEEKPYGACVASIQQWPRIRTCLLHFCAGEDFKHWVMDLLARIKAWAKMNDAQVVEVIGRRGWIKACGFKESAAHMYVEV